MTDKQALEALAAGVDRLADTVKTTLGPGGRNVVLGGGYGAAPYVTNSGFAVAQQFDAADPAQGIGTRLARQLAEDMNKKAGDGTTTALVLMQALLRSGAKAIAAGANPVLMKRGIEQALAAALAALDAQARPVRDPAEAKDIAAVAAGDEEIGELIASALDAVGMNGVINCVESKAPETWLEHQRGMQFPRGWFSASMVTHPQANEAVLEEPFLLMVDKKLESAEELLPILSACAGAGRELVILADDFGGEALAILQTNNRQGTLRTLAVQSPEYGVRRREMLRDIAALTGGSIISEELGMDLRRATLDDLGRARQVRAEKDKTTLIGGAGGEEAVAVRIREVEKQIEQSANEYEETRNRERLGRLTGGVALLHVGGYTDVELQNKKRCVDDAISAVQAAIAGGVVPGGGAAYMAALPAVEKLLDDTRDDERAGVSALLGALPAPLRQITQNSGRDGAAVEAALRGEPGKGYDAQEDRFVDMQEAGITDSLPVARLALELAASTAGTLLTASSIVLDAEDGPALQ